MVAVTRFDERHCHKWALLLRERREKLDKLLMDLMDEDFAGAKGLFQEIFYGVPGGQADPGMSGSLLYHMAMVTKMETETRILLEAFGLQAPDIEMQLWRFYGEFASDMTELSKAFAPLSISPKEVASAQSLDTSEKISLFTALTEKTRSVSRMLGSKNPDVATNLKNLYAEWARHVVKMRARQEYETIKGLLTLAELAKTIGVQRLKTAMEKVQAKFGQETVSIALNVTLKVGLRREKLQSIMLSDHYINYAMDMEKWKVTCSS